MKQDDQFNNKELLVKDHEKAIKRKAEDKRMVKGFDLKRKGWTSEMIKKYLGDPVGIIPTWNGKQTGLYPRSLVQKALADPHVRELREANHKKR
jgi:hypothetical protein